MKLVYVASAYSNGDVAVNVKTAMDAGTKLIEAGFAVIVPHLYHYLHIYNPQEYEKWMAMDFAIIKKCDGLIRLPGYSPGADREEAFAKEQGIPVFHSLEAVCRHFRERAA